MEIQQEVMQTINVKKFCHSFINDRRPKYLLGRNAFAESIADIIDIDGFIDEYTKELTWLGKPIIKNVSDLPMGAMIVSCVVGRPQTIQNKLRKFSFDFVDYFAFYKNSKLRIKSVNDWDKFEEDYITNKANYDNIYNLMKEEKSRTIFSNLVNFRLSHDLTIMKDFEEAQHRQYFEDFLGLAEEGETFVDVGGFDGYTSQEFIKICPKFNEVYFFEPDEGNMKMAKANLAGHDNVRFYEAGLSNEAKTLRFNNTLGSANRINEDGNVEIKVIRLDDVVDSKISFIKMDIEGAESDAIEGAKGSIKKYHPTLAICVYHKFNDFYKIPEQILAIRPDYDLYIRHYTEGIDETVMFFIPQK